MYYQRIYIGPYIIIDISVNSYKIDIILYLYIYIYIYILLYVNTHGYETAVSTAHFCLGDIYVNVGINIHISTI